jgi:predicted TIM-barrel fold metal-dependent hydrolase
VFERHPNLKLVCVEGDAGWAPHYMFRMDHIYNRHRFWMKGAELKQLPSEYFKNNVFLTFQDDAVAYRLADMCGAKQLLWASDFPHSDSTWPNSGQVVMEQAANLSTPEKQRILRDNVVDLYHLDAA